MSVKAKAALVAMLIVVIGVSSFTWHHVNEQARQQMLAAEHAETESSYSYDLLHTLHTYGCVNINYALDPEPIISWAQGEYNIVVKPERNYIQVCKMHYFADLFPIAELVYEKNIPRSNQDVLVDVGNGFHVTQSLLDKALESLDGIAEGDYPK